MRYQRCFPADEPRRDDEGNVQNSARMQRRPDEIEDLVTFLGFATVVDPEGLPEGGGVTADPGTAAERRTIAVNAA